MIQLVGYLLPESRLYNFRLATCCNFATQPDLVSRSTRDLAQLELCQVTCNGALETRNGTPSPPTCTKTLRHCKALHGAQGSKRVCNVCHACTVSVAANSCIWAKKNGQISGSWPTLTREERENNSFIFVHLLSISFHLYTLV